MVKEIDKTNPRNLVEGDTFALKIENNEEYKGQYFILIYTYIPYWTSYKQEYSFRVKITSNRTVPTTKEEIEQLEFVKISPTTIEEEANYEHRIDIISDQYGYIYQYILSIMMNSRERLKDFIFLGNHHIQKPENEYIAETDGNKGWTSLLKNVEKDLIDSYESWNLKKAKKYTPEGNRQSRKNALYNACVTKTSREVFQKVEKEGRVREWLISMGIDPDEEPKEEEEESLIYVGPPEENKENFEEK